MIFAKKRWAKSEDCVWDAPTDMMTKIILTRAFADLRKDLSRLRSLFVITLKIPSCTWENLVDEIKHAKRAEDTSVSGFDRVFALYKCLDDMKLFGISAEKLK